MKLARSWSSSAQCPAVIAPYRANLQLNAAAVIAAHNHPSGSAEPREADKRMTLNLHSALATVGVRLLDHLVLGSAEMVSLAERGRA